MREWMTLLEAKTVDVRFTDLPAGTALFHGTNEAAKFAVPKGPAWFTVTPEGAEQWQDWATPRKRGTPRTMAVKTNRPLRLIVLDSYEVWSELSYKLCREDEAHYGQLARAVKKAGYDGWLSDTEVMISNTDEVLDAVTLEEGYLDSGRAPLYHWTDIESARYILEKGVIYAGATDRVCVTRDKSFAFNQHRVRITLDADKIRHNLRMVPFDYTSMKHSSAMGVARRGEKEERIYGNVPVSAITAITVFDNDASRTKYMEDQTNALIANAKRLGIPLTIGDI